MPWISARLREPDGCPWDREQTHESLRNHLLEEAYEVYDALAGGATPELAGELGDLLLQVVLHAQLAAEEGVFDLTDVWAAIGSKIVRRHPHVFGDAEARTAADVNRQWERIKAGERAEAAAAGDGTRRAKSALDGISRSLPALAASQEMQERAANLGYDWPSIDGVLDKVREEVGELVRSRHRRAPRRGAGRPAVRPRQRRPQDRHRGRGGAARREREVPPPLPARGAAAAARGVALRDLPSRSWMRCGTPRRPTSAGRRRHDDRQQGAGDGGIGNRGVVRADGRRPATCARSRSRWASRSGPRARASSGSATRRSCARRRSRTASRRTSAARARAG